MNTYALDTNIISYYLKKNQEVIDKVSIEINF
jgi:predicted nucleic acid-binding protein